MKVTIEFEDEWSFREFWEEHERNAIGRRIASDLRDELREEVRHGGEDPISTQTWYDRFWALCGENDIDGWGL